MLRCQTWFQSSSSSAGLYIFACFMQIARATKLSFIYLLFIISLISLLYYYIYIFQLVVTWTWSCVMVVTIIISSRNYIYIERKFNINRGSQVFFLMEICRFFKEIIYTPQSYIFKRLRIFLVRWWWWWWLIYKWTHDEFYDESY